MSTLTILILVFIMRGYDLPIPANVPQSVVEIVTPSVAVVKSVDLEPLAYDGSATIVVDKQGKAETLAVPARLNLCPAANKIASLNDLNPGDTIAYRGEKSNGQVVICNSPDHFLKIRNKTGGIKPAPTTTNNPPVVDNEPNNSNNQTSGVVMIGKTIVINGLEVTAVELIEDSRCPSDVTCVWAGQVRATFGISKPGSDAPTMIKELILDGESVEVYGKTIALIDVRPMSKSTGQTPAGDYQFTIQVR